MRDFELDTVENKINHLTTLISETTEELERVSGSKELVGEIDTILDKIIRHNQTNHLQIPLGLPTVSYSGFQKDLLDNV